MAEDRFEQLKLKYQSVLNFMQSQNVQLQNLNMQDNKLFIRGIAPSQDVKDKVWDQIKQVNPNWAQELTADISVDPNGKPAGAAAGFAAVQQLVYTVQPGDTLSKISKEMYGKPSDYMKIFEANRDVLNDPNKINPGQKLKIPA